MARSDDQATRLVLAAWRLFQGHEVTKLWMQRRFEISSATAKRDLLVLESVLPIRLNEDHEISHAPKRLRLETP